MTLYIKQSGKNIVKVPEDVLDTMINLVRDLRYSDKLEKVPSVRASIGLFERAQGAAFAKGNDKVSLQDIKDRPSNKACFPPP